MPVMNRSGAARLGLLVAVVDANDLWTKMQAVLSELVRPAGLQFDLSAGARPRRAGWRPALERIVSDVDPPFHLTLYQPVASAEDRLSRKRLWIYGGMVGLSLLVIAIGLWLMGQAVRREVEIAQLKSDFVANVSHELRTPLSAISYISERLNRGRYRSDEEVKDFYAMLGEEAAHLQEMIEDVLDFSKMLGGKKVYHREPMDLRDAAKEALDRLRAKAEAAAFHLTLAAPPEALPVRADRRAVVHAIMNLIDNAMKYSGNARAVEIRLRRDEGRALVEVSDHGIGIPAEEQAKIFEKFYRVETGTAADVKAGVGLGLAMVSHVMQSHEGRVLVRSEVGKGSTFTLEFPMEEAGANAA
jgi:two-component system phosphate regulon sensor histidine kinase PhoR